MENLTKSELISLIRALSIEDMEELSLEQMLDLEEILNKYEEKEEKKEKDFSF